MITPSTTTTTSTDRTDLFHRYLAARKKHPRSAQQALHIVRYGMDADEKEIATHNRALAERLGLDIEPPRYGRGNVLGTSEIKLDATKVEALGFVPGRLTARVEVSYDDWSESAKDLAGNMGYELVKASLHPEHEDEDRPDHTSVRVNIGGRNGVDHWLTVPQTDIEHFLSANALKGMSKGARAKLISDTRRKVAEDFAEYLRDYSNNEYGPYVVQVKVLWDGEEIGSDSLGGVEIHGYGSTFDGWVADTILGNGMLDTALDAAAKWADAAHAKLPPRAKKCEAT